MQRTDASLFAKANLPLICNSMPGKEQSSDLISCSVGHCRPAFSSGNARRPQFSRRPGKRLCDARGRHGSRERNPVAFKQNNTSSNYAGGSLKSPRTLAVHTARNAVCLRYRWKIYGRLFIFNGSQIERFRTTLFFVRAVTTKLN